MATPPLPDNPTIRITLKYLQTDGFLGGQRFFYNYAGGAPTSAELATLAAYVANSAWNDEIAGLVNTGWALTEVDILDIASETGASGSWTGSKAGTASGIVLPASNATNVEFNIAQRYRGGKPRTYFPPPSATELASASQWDSAFLSLAETAVPGFFNGIVTQGLHTTGDLTHVLLSYYKGYNTTTPPWRGPGFKYPPKYRATALSLPISGYAIKAEVGSQKRRRASTSA